MCFNMSIVTELMALEEEFGTIFDTYPAYASTDGRLIYHQRSGFSHPAWPILPASEAPKLSSGFWGLVPHWTKDRTSALEIQNKTLNARSETVRSLPSFRTAMKQQQRCLIPVSGFFEPHSYQDKSYPFYLHRRGALFALGGIFDIWYGPESGKQYRSFSVLTAPSVGIVDAIHNKKHRMPLLIEKESYATWLDPSTDPDTINELMTSRESDLCAHPVSKQLYGRSELAIAPEVRELSYYGIDAIDNLTVL